MIKKTPKVFATPLIACIVWETGVAKWVIGVPQDPFVSYQVGSSFGFVELIYLQVYHDFFIVQMIKKTPKISQSFGKPILRKPGLKEDLAGYDDVSGEDQIFPFQISYYLVR